MSWRWILKVDHGFLFLSLITAAAVTSYLSVPAAAVKDKEKPSIHQSSMSGVSPPVLGFCPPARTVGR